MRDLLYSAFELANIIDGMKLEIQAESSLIDSIWEGEKAFLEEQYRTDKLKFVLDVRYWIRYLNFAQDIDEEFPVIKKDLEHDDKEVDKEKYTSDFPDMDLFFKELRIRILYKEKKPVRRMLRTILGEYEYQRRSKKIVEHINRCMFFYHLEVSQGGEECDIEEVNLKDMLTFRVIGRSY